MSSIFTKFWDLIKKIGAWTVEHAAPTLVAVVEELQSLWKSGTPGFIASVLDSLTKSGVPTTVVNAVGKELPNMLAVGLAIEGLPADPTDVQIADFEQRVLAAFNVHTDKSQLYTVLGAQLLGIIRRDLVPGQKFTFAQLVTDLEEAYQDYQNDLADNATADPVQDPPLESGQAGAPPVV